MSCEVATMEKGVSKKSGNRSESNVPVEHSAIPESTRAAPVPIEHAATLGQARATAIFSVFSESSGTGSTGPIMTKNRSKN